MKTFAPILLLVGLLFTTLIRSFTTVAAQAPVAGASATVEAVATAATPIENLTEWEAIVLPPNLNATAVNGFAVHPLDAAIAFLATTSGLYKTTNAGQSWQQLGAGAFEYLFEVAIATDNPARLYARSWDLYRSDDAGATWTKLTTPPGLCGVVIAPTQADQLYARRCGATEPPPVVRSSDGGQSWTLPTTTLTQTFDLLAVAPNQPNLLIATNFDQIWRSTDSGDTWVQASVGMRYFGKPVFAYQAPHTLYLGHWTGLLRSQDAGATWEDSSAMREFATLVVAPDSSETILGGSTDAAWQLHADVASWQATSWATLPELQTLWNSAYDPQVVYARNPAGLWRRRTTTLPLPPFTPSAFVFLPLVQRSAGGAATAAAFAGTDFATVVAAGEGDTATEQSTSDQAIAQANSYRSLVGAIPLLPHSTIATAAQNHADYYMANHADSTAWTYGPHGEVENKPKYTGRRASDRVKAAGFAWGGGAEVMHFTGDPVASVDGWIATVFHRLIILDPNAHYTGYGVGSNGQTAVDVMDFGGGPTASGVWSSATPYPLAYPANGQTNVPPSWYGAESPDPLPPGAQRPVGYPVTLQGVGGTLQVTQAELRLTDGTVVPVHPNPAGCANGGCYALIAVAPLNPNTTYVVAASGTVATVPFAQEWRFTTGEAPMATSSAINVATPQLADGE